MTALVWDSTGSRTYETGVDRGVLYLEDGTGIVWNGITAVTNKHADESTTALYFDGHKYFEQVNYADYSGTLTAFTYPDEFLAIEGEYEASAGLFLTNQAKRTFGLSYRSLVGNDVDGIEHGYKIHILYNLTAIPSDITYSSTDDSPDIADFSWDLKSIPEEVSGYRPTSHVIIDSRKVSPTALAQIEQALYGTVSSQASLPSIQELIVLTNSSVTIIITDNGNGTWTATGPDNLFTISANDFQITGVNATFIDANTYQISTT